jgi:hypothetical protein
MGVAIPNLLTEDRVSGAQIVDGSLRFDSGKSHYLSRTPGSAGNQKTWTWSGWVKRNIGASDDELFSTDASDGFVIRFVGSTSVIRVYSYTGSFQLQLVTTPVYRDASSWYHLVVAIDTTQATASNRAKIYVNGSEVTTFSTSTYPNQNATLLVNQNIIHYIGKNAWGVSGLNAQLSNVYFIDGQALGPEYFGYTDPLTNTWRPKKFKPAATPNDGTVWSSSLTAPVSGFGGSVPATNAFDNNLSTLAGTNNAGGANLLFTKTFTNVTRLRVFADHSTGYRMRVNGGTWYSDSTLGASANASWRDLTSIIPAGGTITSIEADTNGANNGVNWAAIEVNGVILLDSDTTNIGKNGFYLPFDGSAPIGQDQSGRGNNWTPVNFGGSNTLEKATGALPILNTDGGGKVARVGVRTDSNASSLVLALPLVGIKSDFSNAVNSGTSNKTVTSVNAVASSAQSNFYGGSYLFNNTDSYLTIPNTDFNFGTGDYTCETWVYLTNTGDEYVCNMQTNNTGSPAPHWGINFYSTNLIRVGRTGDSNGDAVHMITYTFTTNRWYHIAVSRQSGTSRVFLDGVKIDEVADTRTIVPVADLQIGRYYAGGIFARFPHLQRTSKIHPELHTCIHRPRHSPRYTIRSCL